MRFVADQNPVADVDPVLRELVDLTEQRLRIDDHAVADDARDAVVQDPRRNEPQNELRAVHIDRVAGVVSTLIPRDDGEMRRQEIDDLALAFITPLRTEHCEIRGHQSPR